MSPAKRTDITNRMGEIAGELRNPFVRGDNKYAAVLEATVLVERIKEKVRRARRWGAEALATDRIPEIPVEAGELYVESEWGRVPRNIPAERAIADLPPLTVEDVTNRTLEILLPRSNSIPCCADPDEQC